MRQAELTRKTGETDITLKINIDGKAKSISIRVAVF